MKVHLLDMDTHSHICTDEHPHQHHGKKKIVHPSCLLFSGKSMIANQEAIFPADSCSSTSLILCLHFESLSIVDGDLIGQFCSLLVVSWQKLEWQFSVLSDIIAVQSVDSWSLISTLSSSCKKKQRKRKTTTQSKEGSVYSP